MQELCQNEKLTGQCGRDEVILMERALYGRMRFTRCIERDYGYVVSVLLTSLLPVKLRRTLLFGHEEMKIVFLVAKQALV